VHGGFHHDHQALRGPLMQRCVRRCTPCRPCNARRPHPGEHVVGRAGDLEIVKSEDGRNPRDFNNPRIEEMW